jgi:hypothetical protein
MVILNKIIHFKKDNSIKLKNLFKENIQVIRKINNGANLQIDFCRLNNLMLQKQEKKIPHFNNLKLN